MYTETSVRIVVFLFISILKITRSQPNLHNRSRSLLVPNPHHQLTSCSLYGFSKSPIFQSHQEFQYQLHDQIDLETTINHMYLVKIMLHKGYNLWRIHDITCGWGGGGGGGGGGGWRHLSPNTSQKPSKESESRQSFCNVFCQTHRPQNNGRPTVNDRSRF